MLYPLTFRPILKERVWGGRKLQELFRKPLPPSVPVGESWEISDRPGDVSVISNGPLSGKDLHWLVQNHGRELLGSAEPLDGRFPLLIKILDARQKLSLQVHPPAAKAAELGGEPKTEMWYIADAAPGAELYVGLKTGVTRAEFERKIRDGSVADCFHRIMVKPGDTMFLPSGRVHALGAGLVIFEVQQNSDTTYRVYDWDRVGLDGKPRALHIAESLASIDFADFEPSLVDAETAGEDPVCTKSLVKDPLFNVELVRVSAPTRLLFKPGVMQMVGTLRGDIRVLDLQTSFVLSSGQFCLVPASLEKVELQVEAPASFLRVEAGANS